MGHAGDGKSCGTPKRSFDGNNSAESKTIQIRAGISNSHRRTRGNIPGDFLNHFGGRAMECSCS